MSDQQPAAMSDRISLELIPVALATTPGGVAMPATLVLRNTGPLVDRFRLSISGLDASWLAFSEPLVTLMPGAESTVRLALRTPDDAIAGQYPFEIIATSSHDPGQLTSVSGMLDVAVVGGLTLVVSPQRVRTRRTATGSVRIHNHSNADQRLHLVAADPNARLRLKLEPEDILLPPDGEVTARLRLTTPRVRLTGTPRQHTFTVSVLSQQDAMLGAPLAGATGELVQLALMPWLAALPGTARRALMMIGLPLVAFASAALWLLAQPGERPAADVQRVALVATVGVATPLPAAQVDGGANVPVPAAVTPAAQPGLPAGAANTTASAPEVAAPAAVAAAGQPEVPVPAPEATRGPTLPQIGHFGLVLPASDVATALPLSWNWDVRGAAKVSVERTDQGSELEPGLPSLHRAIESAEYTLTATNEAGSVHRSVVVYFLRPPSIETFDAQATQIRPGESVGLSWRVDRAESVFLDDQKVSGRAEGGVIEVQPQSTHEYVLRAENEAGETVRRLQIAVAAK